MNLNKKPSEYLFKQNSTYSDLNFDYDTIPDNYYSNPTITTQINANNIETKNQNLNNKENDDDKIDSYIIFFQSKLNPLYLNGSFDEIIQILDTEFHNFFAINIYFLYFIEKLKFLKMLKEGKQNEAKLFYKETLLNLLKKSKPFKWEKKNQLFISMIKKPTNFNNMNILNNYNDKFKYQLISSIRNYLMNKTNPVDNNHKSKNEDFINNNSNKINYLDTNIENESTKDDFSDFEDEIQIKLCECEDNEANNIQNNLNDDNIFEFNKLYLSDEDTNSSLKKELNQINENSIISTEISNRNNNLNENDTLYKKLPILSSFKPKYAKRETIDKKIIRIFRQFIINQYKKKKFNPSISKDYSFFINLINFNILPPIDFMDVSANEKVSFKSFNSKFLFWFFNKDGIKELYKTFLEIEGNKIINNIYKYYDITEDEKNQLINYITNLPYIFDMTLVNKITKEKDFNHIYRKNKKENENKNPSNTKFKKFRSRSMDNFYTSNKSESISDSD